MKSINVKHLAFMAISVSIILVGALCVAGTVYWNVCTFDDPVGVYVDSFRAMGSAEKVTHPEYQEYICGWYEDSFWKHLTITDPPSYCKY